MRHVIAAVAAGVFAASVATSAMACMGAKTVSTMTPVTTAEAPITPAPTQTPKSGG